MPQVSKLNLPPLDFGGQTLGRRIARIRKERGYTQVELSEKIGITQSIVSAVERDERKLSAEMAIRFAGTLGVTMDELLAPAGGRPEHRKEARPQDPPPPRADRAPAGNSADCPTPHHRYLPRRRRRQGGKTVKGAGEGISLHSPWEIMASSAALERRWISYTGAHSGKALSASIGPRQQA